MHRNGPLPQVNLRTERGLRNDEGIVSCFVNDAETDKD